VTWCRTAQPRAELSARSWQQKSIRIRGRDLRSDWVKEHFPAAGVNLLDALRAGHDRDPEPDLEAEP
jgi:hypothetical protein